MESQSTQMLRILACTFLAISLGEAGHLRRLQSIKAPKEIIQNYEIVSPRITYGDNIGTFPKELQISIPTHNTTYSLLLELNEVILSSGFTSRHYNEHGEEVVSEGHVNCFYQGRVEGHPDWRATMTTCHGLQGSFGDMNDQNSFYHIEPLNSEDQSLEQFHALYLDTEYKHNEGVCGSKHSHVQDDEIHWPPMDKARFQQSATTNYVEWIAVNDFRQFQANRADVRATNMRALAIANQMDELYKSLNIRIVLTESITWSNGDRIRISSNPETLLNTFRELQRNIISTSYDSAMLITGINLDGSTIGIAFIGSMCSNTHSVGVTQDGGRSLALVASTAAHELGHIFNMDHDGSNRQCACVDSDQRCIMAAFASSFPHTKWSSCSLSDLNTGFNRFNTDRCLSNLPTTSVGNSVSVNDIREGEKIYKSESAAFNVPVAQGTRNGCDTHFSDGEVIVEDGVVSIMMQEAGDSGANMVTPQFECRVDGAHRYSPCGGNPIQLRADPGDHEVDIRPHDPDGECRRRYTLHNVPYFVPQR